MWVLRRPDNKFSANVGVNNQIELLVWSEKEHAEYNLTGSFAENTPELISYEYFINEVLPKLEKVNAKILVSTMEETRGKVVSYHQFIQDCEEIKKLNCLCQKRFY